MHGHVHRKMQQACGKNNLTFGGTKLLTNTHSIEHFFVTVQNTLL